MGLGIGAQLGGIALAVGLLGGIVSPPGLSAEPFPTSRPSTRIQAAATLSGGGPSPVTCLTPFAASGRQNPLRLAVPARRALSVLLQGEGTLIGERRWTEPEGTVLRFTTDRGSIDRIDLQDDDANGRPDVAEAAAVGAAAARKILGDTFETGGALPPEIVLVRLGGNLEGLTLAAAGRDGRPLILLDAGLRPAAMGRAAAHQVAHAHGAASGLSPAWGEAFATWLTLRPEWRGADAAVPEAIDRRLSELRRGWDADDLELAAGNAAWLAFVQEAYGDTVLRLCLEELSGGYGATGAFDRALRRASAGTIDEALREFSLWALLTGRLADPHHFSFAPRAASPVFASTAYGLPSLSVQAEPEVRGSGSSRVLIRPERDTGGMALRFEGDPIARWDADLILFETDGTRRRVPLRVAADGKGEVLVPLGGIAEVALLIRNLDPEDRQPHRYSWSATAEPGFPFELGTIEAQPSGAGILIRWETLSERRTLGYNVYRSRDGDGAAIRVNPVWVPAIGGTGSAAAYQYLDTDVEGGVRYTYRIEAVTEEGLGASSESVTAAAR